MKINRIYKNLSVSMKAALWFTICGFVQKGISFITLPIFTRLLTTAQYGIVSVYVSWVGLISILCTLNLHLGGFNNGMLRYEKNRNYYVAALQGLVTLITFIWTLLYIFFKNFWENLLGIPSNLIIVMFIEILFTSAFYLWSSKERYEYRYKKLVVFTILNSGLTSLFAIIAIFCVDKNKGAEAKIIGSIIAIVIVCGYLYIYNFKQGKVFYDKKIWRSSFLFNLPLIWHYLSTMILNQCDRIMISKMIGNDKAGIYSVAYSAGMILNILVSAINQSFAPWIYGKLESKDFKDTKRITNMLFLFLAFIILIFTVFAPECVFILGGKEYMEAINIIPSVACSLYFIMMYQLFANIEFYHEKNRFISYASCGGAVINIILNLIFIRLFGYIAAGYTTLVCYIIFGIAHYIFMRKICKKEYGMQKIFDAKFTFFISIILVILSFFMMIFYDNGIFRYSFLLIAMLLILINYKKIKKIINVLKEKN